MPELQVPELMEAIEVRAPRPQLRDQYPRRIAEHKACGRLRWVFPRLDDGARLRYKPLEMLVRGLHLGYRHGAPFLFTRPTESVSPAGGRGARRPVETAANSRPWWTSLRRLTFRRQRGERCLAVVWVQVALPVARVQRRPYEDLLAAAISSAERQARHGHAHHRARRSWQRR